MYFKEIILTISFVIIYNVHVHCTFIVSLTQFQLTLLF